MVDKHMSCNVCSCRQDVQQSFRSLRQIRTFLSVDTTKTLIIHAFSSSRVDYCNALWAGIPQYQLSSPTNSESSHCCCQINSPLSKISTHHSSIDCTSLVTSKISDGIQTENCFIGLQGSQQHDSNLHF